MDFSKQYIIQSITTAANNLRLSSEKIETVAILKERLSKSSNITEEIKLFKKITELSKLGIRLNEIYNAIESTKIDFLKVSDRFKEHSANLVRELSNSLDNITPQHLRETFQKFDNNPIDIDLTKKNAVRTNWEQMEDAINQSISNIPGRSKADELKEEIIMSDLNEDELFNFEKFEEKILTPVKELDRFLDKVVRYDFTEAEAKHFINLMSENGNASKSAGYEILANMHSIFSRGLELVNQKKLAPSVQIIESLRACLIVIVAVVRGKEVDITSYLNRAETFGRGIFSKQKGN